MGDDLFARVRAGDEEAARLFFREHYPIVARIARHRHSPRQSEEDLCQMIFLKIFSRLDQYAGQVPIAHWISRIAVNTCLAEMKKDWHRQELREADLGEDALAFLQHLPDPAAKASEVAHEAREIVQRLLDHLSPPDRMVVSLLYLDQCSMAETSVLTGLPQVVLKIRAFRARRKLHKLIERTGGKYL